jgi:hypothetical protein
VSCSSICCCCSGATWSCCSFSTYSSYCFKVARTHGKQYAASGARGHNLHDKVTLRCAQVYNGIVSCGVESRSCTVFESRETSGQLHQATSSITDAQTLPYNMHTILLLFTKAASCACTAYHQIRTSRPFAHCPPGGTHGSSSPPDRPDLLRAPCSC